MKQLLLNAPINKLSYGIVATNLLYELQKQNIEVALFPIGQVECDEIYQSSVKTALEKAQKCDYCSPCLRIFHQFSLMEKVGHNNEYFAMPIFELDALTRFEQMHLEVPDHLFVCSEWAKHVLQNHHFKFVEAAPLGVNQEIFKPLLLKYKSPKTIFYMGGKLEKRKNHHNVLDCFNEAFDESSNVELWVSCFNPFLGERNNDWYSKIRNCKLANKIKIINPSESQSQLNYVMNQVSCGISLSRAEGWDLPLLEMMALGIPSIVSNVTAHTEFANLDNSFLVEMPEVEVAEDEYFFKKGQTINQGNWAKFTPTVKDDVIKTLRLVHRLYQQDQLLDKSKACLQTANKFSWANTARIIISRIFEN